MNQQLVICNPQSGELLGVSRFDLLSILNAEEFMVRE
jgi:hypothetical protein